MRTTLGRAEIFRRALERRLLVRREELRVLARAVLVNPIARDVHRAGMDIGVAVVAVAAEEDRRVAVAIGVDEAPREEDERPRERRAIEERVARLGRRLLEEEERGHRERRGQAADEERARRGEHAGRRVAHRAPGPDGQDEHAGQEGAQHLNRQERDARGDGSRREHHAHSELAEDERPRPRPGDSAPEPRTHGADQERRRRSEEGEGGERRDRGDGDRDAAAHALKREVGGSDSGDERGCAGSRVEGEGKGERRRLGFPTSTRRAPAANSRSGAEWKTVPSGKLSVSRGTPTAP